jgi:hypothetical protein
MDELLKFSLIGIPIIYFGGVAFHFLYKYGGKKKWMIVVSPVNESVWEHLKLAFYPTLFFSLSGLIVLQNVPNNYFTAVILGIYSIFTFILITEWIYPRFTKKNILIIDLMIFFLAISFGQLISYLLMTRRSDIDLSDLTVISIILIQTIIFTVFSLKPPRLNLFKDPVEDLYGLNSK